MKNISILMLLLIILIIILIIPSLVSGIYLRIWTDHAASGQVGDTIGGIASPFIEGLAALLVFITFREQVKANRLVQEQIYFQHIQEQINKLELDFLGVSQIPDYLGSEINNALSEKNRKNGQTLKDLGEITFNGKNLNKVMYSIKIFNQVLEAIGSVHGESDKLFFRKKLMLLFEIVYKDDYDEMIVIFNKALEQTCHQEGYLKQIIYEMKQLDNRFSKLNETVLEE